MSAARSGSSSTRATPPSIGRESPLSLYDQDLVTFEEGTSGYNQRDAAGFIRLNALRLRSAAHRLRRGKTD